MPIEIAKPDLDGGPDPLGAWREQVRGAEYAKALADGRVLMWRPIATRPADRAVILGWPGLFDQSTWYMKRATPEMVSGDYATHWREDTLGTPHVVPVASRAGFG